MMAIKIHLADSDLPLIQGISVSGAITWAGQLPLLFKIVTILLLSLIPLTGSILIISRIGIPSPIYAPPQAYLPGNILPRYSEEDVCVSLPTYNSSCLGHLQGHDIYCDYEAGTHKIIRTTVSAEESAIGDLILAWGTPTGFDQYDTSIVVSWGTRSALLVTNSFQPNSRVRFIAYDTEPLKRSPWRGFGRS
jgi:hypothetical protein